MSTLFKCKIANGKHGWNCYTVKGRFYNKEHILATESLEVDCVEGNSVTVNGSQKFRSLPIEITDFSKIQNCPVPHGDAYEFTESLIAAYINDDTSVEFINMCYTLRRYKEMEKAKAEKRKSL